MLSFFVDKKTGFKCLEPVLIYDKRGKVFYSFNRGTEFNLPKGEYKTENELIFLPSPVRNPLPKMKKPEKNNKVSLTGWKLFFVDNPNKASVDIDKKRIYFDNKLKEEPLFIQQFIFYHEIGHVLYYTESKCDNYAARQMIKKGFNPSQVLKASLYSLHNKKRTLKTLQNLKNANG